MKPGYQRLIAALVIVAVLVGLWFIIGAVNRASDRPARNTSAYAGGAEDHRGAQPDAGQTPDARRDASTNDDQPTPPAAGGASANNAPGRSTTDPDGATTAAAAYVIAARCVDGRSGEPLGTTPVRIEFAAREAPPIAARTDAGGRLRAVLQLPDMRAPNTCDALRFTVTPEGGAKPLEARVLAFVSPGKVSDLGTLVFLLGGTAQLSGTVRASAATPGGGAGPALADAEVTLLDTMHTDSWASPRAIASTATDAAGRYVFAELPAGQYAVVGRATDRASTASPKTVLADGETKVVDLVLGPGVTLTGTVTSAATEKPIAGAELTVVNLATFTLLSGMAVSGADGTYTVSGLAPGQAWVGCGAKGFASVNETVPLAAPGPVTHDFALAVGVSLRGRVVDAEGNAVPRYTVRAWHESPDMQASAGNEAGAEPYAIDDPEGRFTIDGLSPGAHTVEVVDGVHARALVHGVEVKAPQAGAQPKATVITLAAGASLSGKVLGDEDAPVAGARLAVARTLMLPNGAEYPYLEHGELVAFSAKDGSYRLTGLPAGTVHVWITHPAYPEQKPAFKLEPGETKAVDFQLASTSPARLSGTAFALDGSPAANATIICQGTGVRRVQATTDTEGKFTIEKMAPGSYLVMLVGTGGAVVASTNVNIKSGDDVTLELGAAQGGETLVTGAVTLGGKPAVNAAVMFTPKGGGGGMTLATTTSEGTYGLRLAPGAYTVVVQRQAPAPAFTFRQEAEVPEAEAVTLNLPVPDGKLIGTLIDQSTGNAIPPGVDLVLELPRAKERGIAGLSDLMGVYGGQIKSSEDDGTFTFANITPGRYRLRAYAKGYGVVMVEPVNVMAGQTVDLGTIYFTAQSSLKLTVSSAAAGPIAGAQITVIDAKGRNLTMIDSNVTGADGTAELAFLATGETYRITALAPGYARGSLSLSTGEALQGSAEIVLKPGGTLVVTVHSAADEPLAGVTVEVLAADGTVVPPHYSQAQIYGNPRVTNPAGTVTRGSLAPGRYTVRATHENRTVTRTVSVPATGPDGPPATLTLKLAP